MSLEIVTSNNGNFSVVSFVISSLALLISFDAETFQADLADLRLFRKELKIRNERNATQHNYPSTRV